MLIVWASSCWCLKWTSACDGAAECWTLNKGSTECVCISKGDIKNGFCSNFEELQPQGCVK